MTAGERPATVPLGDVFLQSQLKNLYSFDMYNCGREETIVNTSEEGEDIETGRALLAYYAERGYTVEDVSVDHPRLGDRPKRTEVTVELTLAEPVSSVLDRMEHAAKSDPDALE